MSVECGQMVSKGHNAGTCLYAGIPPEEKQSNIKGGEIKTPTKHNQVI
jgi:hypothetical protein